MISRYPLAFNFIAFQIGWFACVISAAQQLSLAGSLIALIIVAIHVFMSADRLTAILFISMISLFGFVWDSALHNLNILVFDTGIFSSYLAPHWILMMWLLFATTLRVSLRWLYGRFWLSMAVGAVAGPLAYHAGAAMNAVVIPDAMVATIVLAIGWGGLLPLFMKTAEAFDGLPNRKAVSP